MLFFLKKLDDVTGTTGTFGNFICTPKFLKFTPWSDTFQPLPSQYGSSTTLTHILFQALVGFELRIEEATDFWANPARLESGVSLDTFNLKLRKSA